MTLMTRLLALSFLLATVAAAQDKPKPELPKPDADGWITLFNGKDLTGWEGLENFWMVKDGVISGHETKDASKQTFLVYAASNFSDFELHLKYKFATPDGNSGIQFRSKVLDRSEEHTSELQSRFGISYAVFCLKKKKPLRCSGSALLPFRSRPSRATTPRGSRASTKHSCARR